MLYSAELENSMVQLFSSLNERDRRRYAAIEVLKLGHGGQKYIQELLGIDYKTIQRGIQELDDGISSDGRIRKKGGGRKPLIKKKRLPIE